MTPPEPPAPLDLPALEEAPAELEPALLLTLLLPPFPPLAVAPPLEDFPPDGVAAEVPAVADPPALDEMEEASLLPAPAPPLEAG